MDFSEGLKKIFLAGVGAVAMTAESAKDIVDTLVEKGELTVEQGKVLNEELKHNIKEKVNDHITVNVVKEYGDIMKAVDTMTDEELEQLKEKIAKKEQEKQDNPSQSKEQEITNTDDIENTKDTKDTTKETE